MYIKVICGHKAANCCGKQALTAVVQKIAEVRNKRAFQYGVVIDSEL